MRDFFKSHPLAVLLGAMILVIVITFLLVQR